MIQMIRKQVGDLLAPAARAWVRYVPISLGKPWLWEHLWWREHEFACKTKFGMKVIGNTQDIIQRFLYYFGVWEPHITHCISSALKAGDCFIDVGANIGYYSLLASKLVGPSGKVVAIEASPAIHALLEKHVQLNQLHNIRTVSAAAAAARGRVRLFPGPAGNLGGATTIDGRQTDGVATEVDALPLCEILTADEVQRARFIKIDVEGAERSVLAGLVPLFGRLRPECEIMMEVSPKLMPDGEQGAREIFSVMHEHGFAAFRLENSYGAESYLAGGALKRPVALTDAQIGLQADVLFRNLRRTLHRQEDE